MLVPLGRIDVAVPVVWSFVALSIHHVVTYTSSLLSLSSNIVVCVQGHLFPFLSLTFSVPVAYTDKVFFPASVAILLSHSIPFPGLFALLIPIYSYWPRPALWYFIKYVWACVRTYIFVCLYIVTYYLYHFFNLTLSIFFHLSVFEILYYASLN